MSTPLALPPLCRLLPEPRDLTGLNTFGLVSHADAFVTLTDVSQLDALSHLAESHDGLFVLGGGSNVVLPEQVPGLVVRVALAGVQLLAAHSEAWIVQVGAGVHWHAFVATCVQRGWDGLENLALIPGTVGAAPVQNIGAYGLELADRFLGLTAWDISARRRVEMGRADCEYAYRDSFFKRSAPGRWIILEVRFALPRPWRPHLDYPDLLRHPKLAKGTPTARDVFNAVCEIRRAKLPDPTVMGNAGSFFKNPVVDAAQRNELLARFPGLVSYAQPDGRYKLAAGWLIEQCGWKGRQLGAAAVHDRQALVLVNRGGATARDILALAAAIQTDVVNRYGVELEREPVLVQVQG